MPSATDVNITNRSQFTAYYSLYYDAQTPADIYGPDENYHRVLTSNFALPENTKITMIDLGSDQVNPKYYYYTVTAQGYNEMVTELQTEGEASIPLSKFIAWIVRVPTTPMMMWPKIKITFITHCMLLWKNSYSL